MKNVYDVLRKKELDLETVRRQVDALRCAAPLLIDGPLEMPLPESVIMQNIVQSVTQNNRWPLKVAEAAAPRT
jgi:hypothetical protein